MTHYLCFAKEFFEEQIYKIVPLKANFLVRALPCTNLYQLERAIHKYTSTHIHLFDNFQSTRRS